MDVAEGTRVAAAGGAERLAPRLVATRPVRAAELWDAHGPGEPPTRTSAAARGRAAAFHGALGFRAFVKNMQTGGKQSPAQLRST